MLTIGTPVYREPYAKRGYVAELAPRAGNVYLLGAGGMTRETDSITVAWDDLTFSADLGRGTVEPWAEKARHMPLAPEAVADLLQRCRAAESERRAKVKADADKAALEVAAWRDSIRGKIPADAVAVIVAEMQHDDSDAMTDYFNVTTSQTVILAFSTHTRDNFAEMRKAARNYAPVADLADAPADAEHREKWSMGAGYYLKGGGKYSDGWAIKKRGLYAKPGDDLAARVPFGLWSVPDAAAKVVASEPAKAETIGGVTITAHTHTTKGFQMHIVELPDRVGKEAFSRLMDVARSAHGWYSRAWNGTPAGFAFKDRDAATRFAQAVCNV